MADARRATRQYPTPTSLSTARHPIIDLGQFAEPGATDGDRVAAGAAADRIRAPKSFVDQVLWPEFQELSAALSRYLAEITEKVIREEVHGGTGEADEVDAPRRLGR